MHNDKPATELMAAAEARRAVVGLSQERLAELLGMTQGHYSKLVTEKVNPGRKALASIRHWLSQETANPLDDDARRAEIRRLSAEISMQCMKLAELASRT